MAEHSGRRDSLWMQEALTRVEAELQVIFGHYGEKTLLKEVRERHGVTLADAVERPAVFQGALFSLLGDLGSHLVMGRINKRVWGNVWLESGVEAARSPSRLYSR